MDSGLCPCVSVLNLLQCALFLMVERERVVMFHVPFEKKGEPRTPFFLFFLISCKLMEHTKEACKWVGTIKRHLNCDASESLVTSKWKTNLPQQIAYYTNLSQLKSTNSATLKASGLWRPSLEIPSGVNCERGAVLSAALVHTVFTLNFDWRRDRGACIGGNFVSSAIRYEGALLRGRLKIWTVWAQIHLEFDYSAKLFRIFKPMTKV